MPPCLRSCGQAVAERYATRTVGLLARARQADFFHSPITCANLAKDADLDPLPSHRDFQMLMSDLVFPAYPFAVSAQALRWAGKTGTLGWENGDVAAGTTGTGTTGT